MKLVRGEILIPRGNLEIVDVSVVNSVIAKILPSASRIRKKNFGWKAAIKLDQFLGPNLPKRST